MKRFPIEKSRGQGRPSGQRYSYTELANRWYLIWISEKYGVEPRKFLACFLDAWIHEKSSCNDLSVRCREKTGEGGVFLVTRDQKIIAQVRLNEMALKRLPDVDLSSYPWNQVPSVKDAADSETGDTRIKDVGLRAQHVNLKARVVEKSITKKVYSRFGDSHDLSTAVISDSTGSIKLPLWNAQIGMVSVGDTVQIENGRVRAFRGELQVSVGKRGKLNVIERTN